MTLSLSNSWVTRLTVTVMMLLLAFGGRATVALGLAVNAAAASNGGTVPVQEEEEEHRHATKAAATAAGRGDHRPFRPQPSAWQILPGSERGARAIAAVSRTATHRDADRRNGIGTALRC